MKMGDQSLNETRNFKSNTDNLCIQTSKSSDKFLTKRQRSEEKSSNQCGILLYIFLL